MISKSRLASRLAFTLFAMGVHTATAADFDGVTLDLPIDCTAAPSCFLQNMVDMDLGPERRDPFCGAATYDGHKGTDIRVRDLLEMQTDVPVLAMAAGRVLRIRDGVADRLMETKADRTAVEGRECGNGVVIDHGMIGGKRLTSQTCHLAKGSVVVSSGDEVQAGTQIGTVGLSGATTFPHVHASVYHGNTVIDPMTGLAQGSQCTEGDQPGLWSQSALAALKNARGLLLSAGFAGGPVTGRDLMRGTTVPSTANGPLVFYAQFINLKAGDRIAFTIDGPSGTYAQSITKPLEKPKASYTAFAGRKTPPGSGTYSGTVKLVRDGKTILEKSGVTISF